MVKDVTTFEMQLCGYKQATAQAHVRPHCVCLNFEHTKNSNRSKNIFRNDENRIRICCLIPKTPEIVRNGFGRHSKLMDARSSCCGVPGSPRTKSELSAHHMAPAGVAAHSSSWTPAACKLEERNFEWEVQFRHFLIELIRQEADNVIVGLIRAFNLAT